MQGYDIHSIILLLGSKHFYYSVLSLSNTYIWPSHQSEFADCMVRQMTHSFLSYGNAYKEYSNASLRELYPENSVQLAMTWVSPAGKRKIKIPCFRQDCQDI